MKELACATVAPLTGVLRFPDRNFLSFIEASLYRSRLHKRVHCSLLTPMSRPALRPVRGVPSIHVDTGVLISSVKTSTGMNEGFLEGIIRFAITGQTVHPGFVRLYSIPRVKRRRARRQYRCIHPSPNRTHGRQGFCVAHHL